MTTQNRYLKRLPIPSIAYVVAFNRFLKMPYGIYDNTSQCKLIQNLLSISVLFNNINFLSPLIEIGFSETNSFL